MAARRIVAWAAWGAWGSAGLAAVAVGCAKTEPANKPPAGITQGQWDLLSPDEQADVRAQKQAEADALRQQLRGGSAEQSRWK